MHLHPPRALLHPAALALYRVLRAKVELKWEDPHATLSHEPVAIFACRHGELLPLLFAMEGRGLGILVSPSRDGELLASILQRRGFHLLRGSTHQASVPAVRAALVWLAEGHSLGLAVDGPRGPRGEIQVGLLRLAQRSGVPIVPLRASPERRLVLRESWDRFEFPLPGRPCRIRIGAAIRVAAGAAGLEASGRNLALALGGSFRAELEVGGFTPGLSSCGNPGSA